MAKPQSQKPADNWQDIFIAQLAKVPNVTLAARKAKMSRAQVYVTRNEEPDFAARWEDALEQGIDMAEGEAYRRAVDGVLEPVFQGGVHVGSVRKYSDGLLQFMLKAHRPDRYRDTVRNETTGADGEPVTIRIEYADADPT